MRAEGDRRAARSAGDARHARARRASARGSAERRARTRRPERPGRRRRARRRRAGRRATISGVGTSRPAPTAAPRPQGARAGRARRRRRPARRVCAACVSALRSLAAWRWRAGRRRRRRGARAPGEPPPEPLEPPPPPPPVPPPPPRRCLLLPAPRRGEARALDAPRGSPCTGRCRSAAGSGPSCTPSGSTCRRPPRRGRRRSSLVTPSALAARARRGRSGRAVSSRRMARCNGQAQWRSPAGSLATLAGPSPVAPRRAPAKPAAHASWV